MSNTIWKTPDQKPDNDNDIICLVGALPFAGYYEKFNNSYVEHTTGENYMPDEIDRWCYLDDLIVQADKAERLQKALDFAKSKLNGIHRLYSRAFYTREDWLQVCMEMVDKANVAIEQIKRKANDK